MKLWTIQPKKVLEIILSKGSFSCDENNKKFQNDFKSSYDWLVSKMDSRGIYHPEELSYPIWAWYRYDGKNELPNILEDEDYFSKEEKYVWIELEVPIKEVLLSDYNAWHYVLNKWYLDDSKNEEEWTKIQEEYDAKPFDERETLMIKSWDKIFNIDIFEIINEEGNTWISNGKNVQATFWKIKKEYVKNVIEV